MTTPPPFPESIILEGGPTTFDVAVLDAVTREVWTDGVISNISLVLVPRAMTQATVVYTRHDEDMARVAYPNVYLGPPYPTQTVIGAD